MNWMEWLFFNELRYCPTQTRVELLIALQCLIIQRRNVHELRGHLA